MISFYRLSSFFAVLVVGLWFFVHPSSALAASCTYNATSSANVFNDAQNWSCFHVPTSGDDVFIPAGTSTTLTASVAFSSLNVTGTIQLADFNLTATSTVWIGAGATISSASGVLTLNQSLGNTTIGAGATVTSTSGSLVFVGSVSSTGSVGSSAGSILFGALTQNNGVVDVGSGYTTSSATFVNAGVLRNGSGRFVLTGGDFANYGSYQAQTGTFKFTSTDPQNIYGDGTGSFYNLVLANTSVLVPPEDPEDPEAVIDPYGVILLAHVSSTSFTLASGAFDLNGYRFAATGSFANTGGDIFLNGGTLVGPPTQPAFTDENYATVSSYTNPSKMALKIIDGTRNLSATTTESFAVTVTANGAAGGDQETFTLTETAENSGIFESTSFANVKYSALVLPAGGEFEMTGSGSASFDYLDPVDLSDATTTVATLTVLSTSNAAPVSATSTTGGGATTASGASSSLPPVITTYQSVSSGGSVDVALIAQLSQLGVPMYALIKLPDDGNPSTQEDSAVYYIDADGRRHAFPSANVYFTWHQNFNDIQVVSSMQLAAIPLGKNVTYKPGVKMIKFLTDPKVYAVDGGGMLRWIVSEEVAAALYGKDWNKMIDDVSDAFYTNYTFGLHITSSADFSPTSP